MHEAIVGKKSHGEKVKRINRLEVRKEEWSNTDDGDICHVRLVRLETVVFSHSSPTPLFPAHCTQYIFVEEMVPTRSRNPSEYTVECG